MARNNDDVTASDDDLSPDFAAEPVGRNQRREPSFGDFDEDDEDTYEEPDRDTDYASGYRADSVEDEEDFEDSLSDAEDRDLLAAEDDEAEYPSSSRHGAPDRSMAEESDDDWLEGEDYFDEDEDGPRAWPWGLIAVAIVALALLTAGGYGVMQQRAAMEVELLQLRATLATSASNADTNTSRVALQDLQQSSDKLAATAEALTLENRRLADTVAGLQAQLEVQQAVLTKTPAAAAPANKPATTPPAPVPAVRSAPPRTPTPAAPVAAPPSPVAPRPAATAPQSAPPAPEAATAPAATTAGPWFVNFGSYASRSVAESWAGKLRPGAGRVIIAPSSRDGQTLYRLRVVGLDSKGSAQEVARTLESQLQVSALWVGRE